MKAPGRSMRRHALNELVARALSVAAVPNTKEPQGLCRSVGIYLDYITQLKFKLHLNLT